MMKMLKPTQMLLKHHKQIQKGWFSTNNNNNHNGEVEKIIQTKLTNLKQELQDEFDTKIQNERLEIMKQIDVELNAVLWINAGVSTAATTWILIWCS